MMDAIEAIEWLLEHVTQYKIASDIGVSQPWLSMIKNTKNLVLAVDLKTVVTLHLYALSKQKEFEQLNSAEEMSTNKSKFPRGWIPADKREPIHLLDEQGKQVFTQKF